VQVFNAADGATLGRFLAYGETFTGGVTVSSAIVQDGGRYSVVTAPGAGAPQAVKVFDVDWYSANSGVDQGIYTFQETASIMPYGATFRGGVNVATGPVEGQNGGFNVILTAPVSGVAPLIKSFALRNGVGHGHAGGDTTAKPELREMASLLAYDVSHRAGVTVSAVSTPVGADVIVGSASGASGLLRRLRFLPEAKAFVPTADIDAFGASYRGGVSVGGR
jgi:hypothetical protein